MEPATSFPVAQGPLPRRPPQTAQLGQAQRWGGWRGWARCAFLVILLLAVTGGFAGAVYRARHSPRDLAFVITTYYLIAVLYCCLRKLELLRPDDPAAAPERRRARLAVWLVSVALGNTFALRVADVMPNLALKLAVWGVTAVAMGVAFYFIFRRRDGERYVADHAQAQTDAGRRPESALHGMSPEQRV